MKISTTTTSFFAELKKEFWTTPGPWHQGYLMFFPTAIISLLAAMSTLVCLSQGGWVAALLCAAGALFMGVLARYCFLSGEAYAAETREINRWIRERELAASADDTDASASASAPDSD